MDPVYNTLMAVPAGLALVMLAVMVRRLARGETIHRYAWAVAYGALGFILTLLGAVMTLTWPLSGPVAFDNIAFGEPSLAFGVILIAGSVLLGVDRFWREDPAGEAAVEINRDAWPRFATLLQPLSWFGAAMGLALIAIAFVGPFFAPWEAPPHEPISGEFASHPMIEATFMSGLIALVGLGALAFTVLVHKVLNAGKTVVWARITGWLWAISGALFLLFGAMNFFTHIGLIVNTM